MADAAEVVKWESEQIPDPAELYMRVHTGQLPDGVLHPGVFKEQGDYLSVDWEKYSTKEESRRRAKEPGKIGIVTLIAGTVRAIEDLRVEHEPIPLNRAHSGIKGITIPDGNAAKIRKTKIRFKLFEYFHTFSLAPPEAV